MPLFNQQGQTNSPTNIITVFNALCDIRTESKESISHAIEENISQVFGFER